VDTVAGRAKVIVDGSFCRGTDIIKAIAVGAIRAWRHYQYKSRLTTIINVISLPGIWKSRSN
jgi:hypothetical protein